jgi:hypothetical protein
MPIQTKDGFLPPKGGKRNNMQFSVNLDSEVETIVIHGFAPKIAKSNEPWFQFSGNGVVSTPQSFECANNFAKFWAHGKTLAPNYKPADSNVKDGNPSQPQQIWTADKSQHHVTCVWTKKACSMVAKKGEPCHLVHTPDAHQWSVPANYHTPTISRLAGSPQKDTVPLYESLNLASVPDLPTTDKEAVQRIAFEADQQHEQLADSIRKDCKDKLCPGIYSL